MPPQDILAPTTASEEEKKVQHIARIILFIQKHAWFFTWLCGLFYAAYMGWQALKADVAEVKKELQFVKIQAETTNKELAELKQDMKRLIRKEFASR